MTQTELTLAERETRYYLEGWNSASRHVAEGEDVLRFYVKSCRESFGTHASSLMHNWERGYADSLLAALGEGL